MASTNAAFDRNERRLMRQLNHDGYVINGEVPADPDHPAPPPSVAVKPDPEGVCAAEQHPSGDTAAEEEVPVGPVNGVDEETFDAMGFCLQQLGKEWERYQIEKNHHTPLGKMVLPLYTKWMHIIDQERFVGRLTQGCTHTGDRFVENCCTAAALYHAENSDARELMDDALRATSEQTTERAATFAEMIGEVLRRWARWSAELDELASSAGVYNAMLGAGIRASQTPGHNAQLLAALSADSEAKGKGPLHAFQAEKLKGFKGPVEMFDPDAPGTVKTLGAGDKLALDECGPLLVTFIHPEDGGVCISNMLGELLRHKLQYWFACSKTNVDVPYEEDGKENVRRRTHAAALSNQMSAPKECGDWVRDLLRIMRGMGEMNDFVKSLVDHMSDGDADGYSLPLDQIPDAIIWAMDLSPEDAEDDAEEAEDDNSTPRLPVRARKKKRVPCEVREFYDATAAGLKNLYKLRARLHELHKNNVPFNSDRPNIKRPHADVLERAKAVSTALGEKTQGGRKVKDCRDILLAEFMKYRQVCDGFLAEKAAKLRLCEGGGFTDAKTALHNAQNDMIEDDVTAEEAGKLCHDALDLYDAHADEMRLLKVELKGTNEQFHGAVEAIKVAADSLKDEVESAEASVTDQAVEAASKVVTDAGGRPMEADDEDDEDDELAAQRGPIPCAATKGAAVPPVVPCPPPVD